MKHIIVALAFILTGCATSSSSPDVRSASTQQLLDRRAEINRKLREDDLGVYIGVTRWISHASEKKSVLAEKAAIDAELAHRHVTPPSESVSRADQPLRY